MAQINNVAAKKDSGLDTLLAGLQIYNGVQDIRKRAAEDSANEKNKPADEAEAMKRRMEQMQRDLQGEL